MGLLKPLRLAAIAYDRGFDIDRLLAAACERLSRRGVRLGGLLQVSTGGKGSCASSVQVIDLRTERDIRHLGSKRNVREAAVVSMREASLRRQMR